MGQGYTGLFPTMHWFEECLVTMGGACYVDPMVTAAQAAGATVRCNTRGYLLIQGEAGWRPVEVLRGSRGAHPACGADGAAGLGL